MKTHELIDQKIKEDQGATYRYHLGRCMAKLSDAFNAEKDDFRAHLGASQIGHDCPRKIWLDIRHLQHNHLDGRILRLYNRGHLEEARFEAALLTIGCEVWTHNAEGRQFRFEDIGGHFGGSIDSVIKGIPEMPEQPVLAEYKTHNDNSFKELQRKGVAKSKPEHVHQMTIYGYYFQLGHALYLAVNKNTDELYSEVVPLYSDKAQQYIDRAKDILMIPTIPPKCSETPGWFKCKMCDYYDFCFGYTMNRTYQVTRKTCRSCAYAWVKPTYWYCGKYRVALDVVQQRQGCGSWELSKELIV